MVWECWFSTTSRYSLLWWVRDRAWGLVCSLPAQLAVVWVPALVVVWVLARVGEVVVERLP